MKHFHAANKTTKTEQGFTLLELMVVVVIASVLAAISAPSVLGMYNRAKVNSVFNQVRGSLVRTQREAIRRSTTCTVTIDDSGDDTLSSSCSIGGTDQDIGEDIFNENVDISINNSVSDPITFSYRGTTTEMRTIVVFEKNSTSSASAKCVVISSPLGITRSGNYTGSVTATPTATSCQTQ